MPRSLFDDPDPFRRGALFGGPLPGTPRAFRPSADPVAQFPAASPAATEEAKAGLVDTTLSGLSYLASAADKPARAVRGALTGNGREFLGAAIPFSDSLGLTDPKQAVSPDDLLVHYGLLDKKAPGEETPFFSGRTLAGIGAGTLLDPLTYATFGGSALTQSGRAARAAGLTKNWKHADLISGFTHHTDDLLAAGKSADEIAHMTRQPWNRVAPSGFAGKADEPLAGAIGLGLPFRDPMATLGHGGIGRGIAGAFDSTYDAIKFAPGVRTLRQWLTNRAGRSPDAIAQRAHEVAGEPLTRSIQNEAGVWEHGARGRLHDTLQAAPEGSELEGLNLIANRAEATPHGLDPAAWEAEFNRRSADNLTPGVSDPDALRAHVQSNFGQLQGIGAEINQRGPQLIDQAQHHGLDPHILDDLEVEYARRRSLEAARSQGKPGSGPLPERMFPTSGSYDKARIDTLRDVPGGRHAINRWGMDPRLSGPARTLAPDQVSQHVLGDMFNTYNDAGQFHLLTPEVRARLAAKAADVQGLLGNLDPLHAANKLPFYNPDVIGDLVNRTNLHARAIGGAAGAVEGLAAGARPAVGMVGTPGVPLDQALQRLGLHTHRPYVPVDPADLAHLQSLGVPDVETARSLISAANRGYKGARATVATLDPAVVARVQRQGYTGGMARLYEQMARHGAPLENLADGSFDPQTFLRQFHVSEKDLSSLGQYMTGFTTPHEAKGFLSGLDRLQSVFKAWTYPLWPAAHARNEASIQYNNLTDGVRWGNQADSVAMMRGGGVEHARYGAATAAMTPAERTRYLAGLAYGHAGVFSGGSFNEVSRNPSLAAFDTLSGQPGRTAPLLPGSGRFTPGGTILGDTLKIGRDALRDTFTTRAGANPLGIRGVGGGPVDSFLRWIGKGHLARDAVRTEDTFAPLVAGRKIGENVEDQGRLAHFLSGLEKGMTPEVAGAATKKVHFDYGDLTPVESNYLRKLVPFYTFMRKNLPYQAELLNQRPSAIVPTIRAMTANGGSGRDGYVPEHLASGPALNLGKNLGPDGKLYTRFLSGTGLPVEEALERLKFQQWDVGGHKITTPDLLGTGRNYLGMLNGYMKAPLELMTGTQLHTGRKLSDLHKPTPFNLNGLIPGALGDTASEIGANSPLARAGSSYTKAVDPRKPPLMRALNLLTGLKFTDVDTEKAYDIEARKALEAKIHQDPRVASFTDFYVKPDQRANVDPALRDDFEVFSRLKRQAHEEAEKRKREAMLRSIEGGGLLGGATRGP